MTNSNELDISVIIPFKDKSSMTLACVNSLRKFGPNVKEILLVSNNSKDTELNIVRVGVEKYNNTNVITYNKPFNYQKINNWAVKKTSGKFILFLNNDTELNQHSVGLLEKMYDKAALPDVGAVGCLLMFAGERKIQHAGVFLVPGGLAEHMYISSRLSQALNEGGSTKEYPYDITKDIPMTAVTGAVTLVERKKFYTVNGFDERFIICGGDVDLCIRLNAANFQTWFVGGPSYIIHKESISRKFTPIPYSDFYWSYMSYVKGYDDVLGDPFLPKISRLINY